jgi:single-strand DNA-binding protein
LDKTNSQLTIKTSQSSIINHQIKKIMNQLRNNVQLIGNLGMNPEIITLENGKKLAKMTVATNETYKNQKGETVKETQWHNITAWAKQAEIAEKYLTKGKQVCVQGKLSNRSYTDKEGVKRYITEIICQEILMLGQN